MGKRHSKLSSAKSRVKISKKLRASFRKEQLAKKKRSKLLAKIPKSVLMLDSERELLKRIKEQAKQRAESEQAVPKEELPCHIERLTSLLPETDVFIEIIDARDIQASRSYDSENLIINSGKQLCVYLSHFTAGLPVDLSSLNKSSLQVLSDISLLGKTQSICVFGQARSGKYTLSQEIARINPAVTISRVKVPVANASLAAMLRGAIDEKEIDHFIHFKRIWACTDSRLLSDFYRLPSFGTAEEFLDALSPLPQDRIRKRREAAALRFFRDIKTKDIPWIALPDRLVLDLKPKC